MISRFKMFYVGTFLTTLSALALLQTQAMADLTFVGTTVSGGTFVYDLNFSNSTDAVTGQPVQRLDTTSFATIYDISGLTSVTLNPVFSSLFVLSQQATGFTPAGITPIDTAVPNVTLRYIGANTTADASYAQILTVNSTFTSLNTKGQFSGVTTKNTGAAVGTPIGSIGQLAVPGVTATNTPEPGSIALLVGAGLSGSMFAFRRRRK